MIAAFRAWWDRLVWSQIRESRDRAVRAEQRATDLTAQLATSAGRVTILERQLETMRREGTRLREENVRLLQAESLLHTLLEIDELPELDQGGAA